MKKYDKSSILKKVNEEKEKMWDNRFTTLKITEYDSYKDINYLSLGLIKAKIKYEKEDNKKIKRAYSIKESFLNHNNDIKPSSLNSPRNNNKIKFNIFSKNKKTIDTEIIPNSCKKQKNDYYTKNIILSPEKNENLTQKKQFLTPFYKVKNYSFKENRNNSNNLRNYFINEVLIKIQGDEELTKLYKNVKELWNNYGVTTIYKNNFILSLNDFFISKKVIHNFLNIEKNYMIKFKNEYSLVVNKIIQRDNEINNLKNLIKEYSNKNKNSQNNINIDSDIKNSLKLIRLYTINLVSQIKKFYLINSHLILSGKIDLNKIKINNYNLGYNYLTKIKKDLEFLKYSSIYNLYNFKDIGNDPFLLSLSDMSVYNNINKNINSKYETLPITEEVYNQIIKLLFFMNQIKINHLIEKTNTKIDKNIPNNYSDNWLTINKDLDIGNNYKGSIDKIIKELKNDKKTYNKIFLNGSLNINNKKKRNLNLEKIKKCNNFIKTDINNKDNEETNNNIIKEEIPLTTAEQLQNKFKQYEEMKQIIEE